MKLRRGSLNRRIQLRQELRPQAYVELMRITGPHHDLHLWSSHLLGVGSWQTVFTGVHSTALIWLSFSRSLFCLFCLVSFLFWCLPPLLNKKTVSLYLQFKFPKERIQFGLHTLLGGMLSCRAVWWSCWPQEGCPVSLQWPAGRALSLKASGENLRIQRQAWPASIDGMLSAASKTISKYKEPKH